MGIRIQMIGTGNQFGKRYFNNNALVYDNQHTLMIDCGMTGPLALHHIGKSFADIDGILITHLHADHIGGLEEAAFSSKFIHNKKPFLFIPEPLITPLWEHSLKAGLEEPEFGHSLESYFEVVPLYSGVAKQLFPGITIEVMQTLHVKDKPSFSLILNEQIFYSADVQFSQSLIEEMVHQRQCKYILHDCQLEDPPTVHATLSQLLTLPTSIQEKITLMHYGDRMEAYIGRTGAMHFMKQAQIYHYDD